MYRKILSGFLIAIPLTLGSGALMAQDQSAEEVDPSDFSQEELQQFANAWDEVTEIREDYTQRMQEAEDRDAARELQQEANDEMVEAVRDTGISLESYGAIAQAAASSPELADRINQYRE